MLVREPSLTYCITKGNQGSSIEEGFKDILKETGAQHITVLRELGSLTRFSNPYDRPAKADIYVSTKDSQDAASLLRINRAFQAFAATLKPHKTELHLIPTSQKSTEELVRELRDPSKYRNPIVWEGRLS